jgi:hypothetical protein
MMQDRTAFHATGPATNTARYIVRYEIIHSFIL